MGSTLSVVKTLVIPAVISLILFLVCTYLLVPLWRVYRNRYSHYLPLDSLSNRTTSLRVRVQNAVARWLVPSTWRMDIRERMAMVGGGGGGGDADSDVGYSSEEGEELDVVHDDPRHALSLDAHHNSHIDSIRRLSRDLEEGFRDDSDEEDNQTRGR
ncbi:hypothetical protein GGR56DRAFT_677729 [Xylariaceae sp. FL0804]|nr:hypothetical protein GGR56DRAFT_677729 [Xylariaceae sp. FL0804]